MKTSLMDNLSATLTVPSQRIHAVCWSRLFKNDPNGVGEPNGIMRRIGREEEHTAFVDRDIAVGGFGCWR